MGSERELKPCPFCGTAAGVHESRHDTDYVLIGCGNEECIVQPDVDLPTRAEAVAAWNTRASEQAGAGEGLPDGWIRCACGVYAGVVAAFPKHSADGSHFHGRLCCGPMTAPAAPGGCARCGASADTASQAGWQTCIRDAGHEGEHRSGTDWRWGEGGFPHHAGTGRRQG